MLKKEARCVPAHLDRPIAAMSCHRPIILPPYDEIISFHSRLIDWFYFAHVWFISPFLLSNLFYALPSSTSGVFVICSFSFARALQPPFDRLGGIHSPFSSPYSALTSGKAAVSYGSLLLIDIQSESEEQEEEESCRCATHNPKDTSTTGKGPSGGPAVPGGSG